MRKQAAFKQLQWFQGEMWLKRIKTAGFSSGGTSGLLLFPGSVCLIQESSSGFWHDYDVVGKSSNRAKSGHNPGGEENAEVGVISASCVRQPCNSTADCKLQRCEAGRREQDVWLQSEPTLPLITGWRSVLLQGRCHRRRVAAAQKTPKRRPPPPSASEGDPSVFRLAFGLSV